MANPKMKLVRADELAALWAVAKAAAALNAEVYGRLPATAAASFSARARTELVHALGILHKLKDAGK